MTRIQITTDSTSDLSPALLKKHSIAVAPLYVVFGSEARKDGVDAVPQDIYDYVSRTGQLTKSSAVSVGEYLSFFSSFVEKGMQVVHINISGDLSGCYQNACIAAAELGHVEVVDSRNLSTGSGLLALRGAELASEGASAQEIREELHRLAPCVEASFIIDTLRYLHMGGRCSSVAALGANLLQLKPCIEVRDGRMLVGKKYRGRIERCIPQYIGDRLTGRDDIDLRRIFITHTAIPDGVAAAAERQIRALLPFAEVLETSAGCTITNHCGPGTLGILFLRQ